MVEGNARYGCQVGEGAAGIRAGCRMAPEARLEIGARRPKKNADARTEVISKPGLL